MPVLSVGVYVIQELLCTRKEHSKHAEHRQRDEIQEIGSNARAGGLETIHERSYWVFIVSLIISLCEELVRNTVRPVLACVPRFSDIREIPTLQQNVEDHLPVFFLVSIKRLCFYMVPELAYVFEVV